MLPNYPNGQNDAAASFARSGGRFRRNPLMKPRLGVKPNPMMAKPINRPIMAKPALNPMMAKPIRDPSMPGQPADPTEDVAVSTGQKPRNATLPGTVDGPTYDGSGINPQMGVTRDYVASGPRGGQGPMGGPQFRPQQRPRMAAVMNETGAEDMYGARRRNPLMQR